MLTLEILCVGKLGAAFLREGCGEYIKRLTPYAKALVTELPEVKLAGDTRAGEEKVIQAEGARLLAALDKRRGAAVVAMCVEGEKFSSERLAAYIARAQNTRSHIVFVIGGSLGLSAAVKSRADVRMSVSDMTFPCQRRYDFADIRRLKNAGKQR